MATPVAGQPAETGSSTPAQLNGAASADLPENLDASAPMSEIVDFGVDWPDMDAFEDANGAGAGSASAIAGEQRYSVRLDGIADIAGAASIRGQFNALSILREYDGDPAVVAQIDRRASADEELVRQIMRSHGYYDAQISAELIGETGRDGIDVVISIDPGLRYHFDSVSLPGLADAGARTDELREQFPVDAGDPVDAAAVGSAQVQLTQELGNRGYPFAEVGEEEVVIDHANRAATLTLPVTPGGERAFGSITVSEGAEAVFGADHVATIARFEPGQRYSDALVDDLRRALIHTGLIARAELTPVDPGDNATVDLDIAMQAAPPRTVSGDLGFGTGEGFRLGLNWEHRNLFPPEGAFGVRGVAGTDEQFFGLSFRRNNFTARDRILSVQAFASDLNREAFDARTAGVTASFERVTNQIWQKEWYWSVGAQLLASDERDLGGLGVGNRQTFFIAALPLGLHYDGTNDLLNPETGVRVGAFLSPELSLQDDVFGYARIQLDASAYFPIVPSTVLAGRMRLGTMPGASTLTIAPSRRFYAGGGGSVRGYGYQRIGPRDANNDPIGGRSLIEMSLEARYRFGVFGIVPFVDAGAIYDSLYPDFSDLRFGAGLGLRYYSAFGPIRIDVGTPLNPQPGDPVIAVYVSLGQAF